MGPILVIAFLILSTLSSASSSQAVYDLVILNGRVIDPESRSDAVRNLGISNGTIKTAPTRFAGAR